MRVLSSLRGERGMFIILGKGQRGRRVPHIMIMHSDVSASGSSKRKDDAKENKRLAASEVI